ncbi:I78 family peptidase inhibitor [Oceanicola sp. S124]|uniref:I78 family peptidase inhibitor n=1 Tax=Oceanicola sp. S124 TaxID=1042378 RepID=UPI000255908E|nr:I78 family peptidase inhibitor [Oceanicola sp. S124]
MKRPALAPILAPTLALLALTTLAAMSRAPEATPCGSELHEDLVGQQWSDDMTPQREGPVRVLHPDSMATMDHRPDRLNIHVAKDGKVSELRCG